jgi:hypothetical protein
VNKTIKQQMFGTQFVNIRPIRGQPIRSSSQPVHNMAPKEKVLPRNGAIQAAFLDINPSTFYDLNHPDSTSHSLPDQLPDHLLDQLPQYSPNPPSYLTQSIMTPPIKISNAPAASQHDHANGVSAESQSRNEENNPPLDEGGASA